MQNVESKVDVYIGRADVEECARLIDAARRSLPWHRTTKPLIHTPRSP